MNGSPAHARPTGGAYLVLGWSLLLVVPGLCAGFPVHAGPNAQTTLPLQGFYEVWAPCLTSVCEPGVPSQVNVALGWPVTVVFYVRNYNSIAGVMVAFDWGGWTFTSSF